MYNDKMVQIGQTRSAIRELYEYGKKLIAEKGSEKVFDFTLGNPTAPTPQAVNNTIAESVKCDPSIHSYTSAEGLLSVREKIADYNRRVHGMNLSPNHIYLTCGANAGLAIALNAIVTTKQNEVVLFVPHYPEYRVFAENCNAKVVCVPLDEKDFQINFDALEKLLTKRTAAVIVNSPNNPSGIVYTSKTLEKLAEILRQAQNKFGNSIVLISDEPYREIVYNGKFESPLCYYKNSVLCYSYSKSFSLAGERIGYLAVSDEVQNADRLYAAIHGAGRALGYVCAPSLFQKVVESCIDQPTDISQYRENRDILVANLTKLNFEVVNPQGAFYLLIKAPNGSADKFSQQAKQLGILFVPTDSFGLAGYVRVATCVSSDTVVRSLPMWQQLAADVGLI